MMPELWTLLLEPSESAITITLEHEIRAAIATDRSKPQLRIDWPLPFIAAALLHTIVVAQPLTLLGSAHLRTAEAPRG